MLAANIAAPHVPEGYGWALIPLTVKNAGAEPATFGQHELILHAGGWSVSHRDVLGRTVRMPDELGSKTLEPDEQAFGYHGFWLPDYAGNDHACVLELRVDENFATDSVSHWIRCE